MATIDFQKLAAPLYPEEVEWKIQTSKGGKTLVVPYITNRSIIKRLNDYVGPGNWQNSLTPYTLEKHSGFICQLKMRLNGEWIQKEDTANLSDIEALKGGASDAMKRCAVQFGIGLDLYEYPTVYVEGEHKYLPDWAFVMLDKIVERYHEGKLDRGMYFLKQADAAKFGNSQAISRPKVDLPTVSSEAAEASTAEAGPEEKPLPKTGKQVASQAMQAQFEADAKLPHYYDQLQKYAKDVQSLETLTSAIEAEKFSPGEHKKLSKQLFLTLSEFVTTAEKANEFQKLMNEWRKKGLLHTDDMFAIVNDIVVAGTTIGFERREDKKFYPKAVKELAQAA